jgi:hypothetical protein
VRTRSLRSCVDGRARLAGCRSVRLHAGPARGGRAYRQVRWHRLSGPEVHLVRRLAAKRGMRQDAVMAPRRRTRQGDARCRGCRASAGRATDV